MTALVSIDAASAIEVRPSGESLPSAEVLRAVDDLMAICRPAGFFLYKMNVGSTREVVNGIGVGESKWQIGLYNNKSSDRAEFDKAAWALKAIEEMPGGFDYLKAITLSIEDLSMLRRQTDDPFRGALFEFDDAQTADERDAAQRKIEALAPRTLTSTFAFTLHLRANLSRYGFGADIGEAAFILDKIAGGLRNARHFENERSVLLPDINDEDPIIEDISRIMLAESGGRSRPFVPAGVADPKQKYGLIDRAPTSMRGAIAALKIALAEHERHHVNWPPRHRPAPEDQLIAAMIKGALGVLETVQTEDEGLLQLGREFELAWQAERNAFEAAPIDADVSDIPEPCSKLATQIIMARAHTFAGLKVKARAVAWCRAGDIHDNEVTGTDAAAEHSIILDLLGRPEEGKEIVPDTDFWKSSPDAAPKPRPDAELITLAEQLETAWAGEEEFCRAQPEDIAGDDACAAHSDTIWAIAEKIGALRATTWEGARAKALAFAYAKHQRPVRRPREGECGDIFLAHSLAADLLGEARVDG